MALGDIETILSERVMQITASNRIDILDYKTDYNVGSRPLRVYAQA